MNERSPRNLRLISPTIQSVHQYSWLLNAWSEAVLALSGLPFPPDCQTPHQLPREWGCPREVGSTGFPLPLCTWPHWSKSGLPKSKFSPLSQRAPFLSLLKLGDFSICLKKKKMPRNNKPSNLFAGMFRKIHWSTSIPCRSHVTFHVRVDRNPRP